MEVNLSATIAEGCSEFSGKSFLRRIFGAISLLLVLAGLARAQSYPEFDGVYFKMNDGSFVELPIVGNVDATAVVTLTSEPGLHPSQWLWHADQYSNVPLVDLESAQSIVVVGSDFRDLRWTPFNSFNDRYHDFISDPKSTIEFEDYVPERIRSTDLSFVANGNYIYRGNCGLDETSVKVRRVSDFVTELLPDGYRWPSAQNFSMASLRDRGCNWQPIPAQVVEVVVDGRFYAFKPKAGQEFSDLNHSANTDQGEVASLASDSEATASVEGAVEASPDTYIAFQSPTGNIHCSIHEFGGETQARCTLQEFIPTLGDWPSGCAGLNREFSVTDLGEGSLSCSDANLVNGGNSVLTYGESISLAGVSCVSAKTGMTCTNAEGHGFSVAKAQQSIY
jgi:hypothetical protein